MPARQITLRHRYLSGRVATSKGMGPQAFESMLEQDFLLLLEFNASISRYASQPITIRWQTDGKNRRYTPDVLVEYTKFMMARNPYLRPTLFEIKPEEILRRDWQKLKPRYQAATKWARSHDCRFRIITEKHIQTPYLRNVKFLLQFGKNRFRFVDSDVIGRNQAVLRTRLFELIKTTPNQLLASITQDKQTQIELIPYIWQLVSCSSIGVDLTVPLTMESSIWTRENGTQLASTLGITNRNRILEIINDNSVELPEC